MANVIEIPNIYAYKGGIPAGYDLVEYEAGADPEDGMVLYGFDEVGMFGLANPKYAFVNLELGPLAHLI